ncbi:MAG: hypothetical protein C4293_18980 [Nitrospiraceae bacterium]
MRTYGFGQPPKDRIVAHSAQKVGNVCATCNNGWMSRLEDDLKPILTPMIIGNSISLTLGANLLGSTFQATTWKL